MKLPITQFMRPNGRIKKFDIEIPDEYAPQVEKLNKCNCYITCEQTQFREAVQYVTCDNPEGDFDIIITDCGKAADKALFELLNRFDENKFAEWKKNQENQNDS